MAKLTIRAGGPADEQALFALFDEAVAWMVARGQQAQWGAEPPSSRADWQERIRGLATGEGLYVLEHEQGPAIAALAVGEAPDYVPASAQAELYIHLLLTARRERGRGLGSRLVAHAERRANGLGVEARGAGLAAAGDAAVERNHRAGHVGAGA